MDRKQIKQQARMRVQQNLLMAVALFLVPLLIQVVMTSILGVLGGIGNFLASIINFVLGAFISLGYAQAFLRLNRSGQGQLDDLLIGLPTWERTIMLAVWRWLYSLLWIIAPLIVFIISSVIFTFGVASDSGVVAGFAVIFMALSGLATGVMGFFVQIRYGFANYLLLEEPTLAPKDCLTKSKEMVQGNYGKLIAFYFSFFAWFLLSAVTFGLATLFIVPYILTAYAGVYDTFKQLQPTPGKAGVVVPTPTPAHNE